MSRLRGRVCLTGQGGRNMLVKPWTRPGSRPTGTKYVEGCLGRSVLICVDSS